AGFEAEDAVDLLLLARDQDDTDVRMRADLARQRQAVFARQLDVEQHEDDVRVVDETDDFVAIAGRRDLEAFVREIGDELFAGDRLVFDDENVFLFGHFPNPVGMPRWCGPLRRHAFLGRSLTWDQSRYGTEMQRVSTV